MNTFLSTVTSHLTALCQNIRAPLPESGHVRVFFSLFSQRSIGASESNVRYPPDVDVFTYVGLFMTRVNRIPAFLRGWSTCLLKSRDGASKIQWHYVQIHPPDETLNRGSDSLWSFKIPLASDHHGLLTIPTSADWLHHSVSSPPVSWRVVGVLAYYGCRRIIQVDAAHWWWMRRYPPYYVECLEKAEKCYINVINCCYCYY